MIDPNIFISYAQYNEDLILSALLHDVKQGFYVDVGANYPVVDSVTKLFYEKGWRGINIEPIESLYKQLAADRPDDINLQLGVGAKAGEANFREYTDIPGHSTFDDTQKKSEGNLPHKDYKVGIKTLAEIFREHKVRHIHFLKIDVEGFEYEVVQGNDWKKYRPEIICIEANHISKDWQKILLQNNYQKFIFDGLNEYYVAEESWSRTKGFAAHVAVPSYNLIKQHHYQQWKADVKNLDYHVKLAKKLNQENDELKELLTLTLKGRPMRSRLKRAAYGLTVDWYKYKKVQSKNKYK